MISHKQKKAHVVLNIMKQLTSHRSQGNAWQRLLCSWHWREVKQSNLFCLRFHKGTAATGTGPVWSCLSSSLVWNELLSISLGWVRRLVQMNDRGRRKRWLPVLFSTSRRWLLSFSKNKSTVHFVDFLSHFLWLVHTSEKLCDRQGVVGSVESCQCKSLLRFVFPMDGMRWAVAAL